ncbi:Uncharacterised protein [Bordetella pertussis]|nr:Uncharacterised protein [Bordetella pertussis]
MDGNCKVLETDSPAWRARCANSAGTGSSASSTRSAPSIWPASRSSARPTRSARKPTLVTAATATTSASTSTSTSRRSSPARASRIIMRKPRRRVGNQPWRAGLRASGKSIIGQS